MEKNGEYTSTHELLMSSGFGPEQALAVRRRISVKENNKRYTMVTSGVEESVVYAVDGVVVKTGMRCDKLVLVRRTVRNVEPEHWTESFVELKGVDTNHAIDQLRECLKNPIFKHSSNDDIRARIVAQSFPAHKSDPVMERAKQEFRKNYRCDLRSMKTGQEDKL